jgi:hypothetical protein
MKTTAKPQLIIKSRQLTAEDLKSLQIPMKIEDGFIVLERSARGHPFKSPVKIAIEQVLNAGQKGLVTYVIQSLSRERPKLIPFAFQNKTLLKLAKYLLRYRTGSPQTLYLYIECISR